MHRRGYEESSCDDLSIAQKVLSVKELRKTYGKTVAVDGISFGVDRNEIVGLLGPNGAGKTTTINMIPGVLEPSSGSILIAGMDVAKQRSQAIGCTNFAAVYAPLPLHSLRKGRQRFSSAPALRDDKWLDLSYFLDVSFSPNSLPTSLNNFLSCFTIFMHDGELPQAFMKS
jgi:energy-coupling factor transporter ATP-binding protein EcfA2